MGTHPIFESDFDCLTAFSEMSYYTIWMGDLPPDCRREHVIKFFEGYGTLGGIRLMNNFGFVDFKHKRDAKDAVKDLNGEKLRGARIRLEMSDGPGNRKSGTSYEETAAFSTMREERGFNPRFERPYRTKYGMAVSNLTKKFRLYNCSNFIHPRIIDFSFLNPNPSQEMSFERMLMASELSRPSYLVVTKFVVDHVA